MFCNCGHLQLLFCLSKRFYGGINATFSGQSRKWLATFLPELSSCDLRNSGEIILEYILLKPFCTQKLNLHCDIMCSILLALEFN